MAFLTPAFLFGALAVAVPIVLHFLRRERLPRLPFSDLRLLRGARVEQTRRQSLRELLLLALRVAAVLLLALAFARPFFADRAASGARATVVLVDTSFSVSAPGQAAEARALAHAVVDAVPAGSSRGWWRSMTPRGWWRPSPARAGRLMPRSTACRRARAAPATATGWPPPRV